MKKTHPLLVEGKKPDRVRDALKHTLRQYVRRERHKPLPEGVDFWDFDCQMGLQADTAERVWGLFETGYLARAARLVAGHLEARAALAERDAREGRGQILGQRRHR